ncbi:hypothetical protein KAH55_05420, partial [bacterium]|nr:hypothetical protein [bacterium]
MALNIFQQGYPLPLVADFDNSVWYPVNGTPTLRAFWQGAAEGEFSIWYGVDLGRARQIQHQVIELAASDLDPRLGLPREMRVEYFSKGGWRPVNSKSSQPLLPVAGKNVLRFSPLFAQKISRRPYRFNSLS